MEKMDTEWNYTNSEWCGFISFTNLFNQKDFSSDTSNPFYIIYYNLNESFHNSKFNMSQNEPIIENKGMDHFVVNKFSLIFFSLCYAYSLFRLMIDSFVIYYTWRKISFIEESIKEKKEEYWKYFKILKFATYSSVLLELLMSCHNFITWRGLQYYTSYQDNYFPSYYKPGRESNCIYSSDRSNYLNLMYSLWLYLSWLGMGSTYFSVLILSRINRKKKTGSDFFLPIGIKAAFYSFLYIILLGIIIFYLKIPIFYKFYNPRVLGFWFFWKVIGFFILIDKLHLKYSLTKNLKVSSETNYEDLCGKFREMKLKSDKIITENKIIESGIKKNLISKKKADPSNELEKSLKIINENKDLIFKEYKNSLNMIYEKIREFIEERNEKEKEKNLKTNWSNYLNYLAGINLLGIIGYYFLLFDALDYENNKDNNSFNPYENYNCKYFLGVFFCYSEIIIYDLTNGIYLLHSFFIKMYKEIDKSVIKPRAPSFHYQLNEEDEDEEEKKNEL